MTIEMKFIHDDSLSNLFYKAAEYIDNVFRSQLDEISDVTIEKDDNGIWHLYITFVI